MKAMLMRDRNRRSFALVEPAVNGTFDAISDAALLSAAAKAEQLADEEVRTQRQGQRCISCEGEGPVLGNFEGRSPIPLYYTAGKSRIDSRGENCTCKINSCCVHRISSDTEEQPALSPPTAVARSFAFDEVSMYAPR